MGGGRCQRSRRPARRGAAATVTRGRIRLESEVVECEVRVPAPDALGKIELPYACGVQMMVHQHSMLTMGGDEEEHLLVSSGPAPKVCSVPVSNAEGRRSWAICSMKNHQ